VHKRIRLLGRPQIESGGQPCPQPRGFKSWALLTRVALSERPVSRRELAGELFFDANDPLGALRWSLADLRRSLDLPDVLRGDPVCLTPDQVWVDVWALEDGTLPAAEIGGALLEGIEPQNCPRFETWILVARPRSVARSMEELRRHALDLLTTGDAEQAVTVAGRAAGLDSLDEPAQELFLRALVAAGHEGQAAVHLASCEATFAREGLVASPALRAAARGRGPGPRTGLRARVVAASLLRAGTAALDAGAADAGIETLRRAADEALRARDLALQADILCALGSALVHAVRGFDGEGAVVLHQALASARSAERPGVAAEILRELAFVDVQAGRHASAARALQEAARHASAVRDDTLLAAIRAVEGMNEADQGRHVAAATLLIESAEVAGHAGRPRRQAWSLGVLARSLLLSGEVDQARKAAEDSIEVAHRHRWNAFLPWPQVLRSQALAETGDWDTARDDAENAFALACELGDPCWEGMAGRALGLIELHTGDPAAAQTWIADARRRCDRVSDRYVWVSAYIALADLELAVRTGTDTTRAADRLHDYALRTDLPEFLAWALVHQAEAGDDSRISLARSTAEGVTNPLLQARVRALGTGRGGGAHPHRARVGS
jgi:DNA-binding SARP family transcriptional activator